MTETHRAAWWSLPRTRARGGRRVAPLAALLGLGLLAGCGGPGQQDRCGNGALDPGEACDDGNTEPGDGCDGACRLEACGDGACGPAESGANCPEDCSLTCGDGVCDPDTETEASCPLDCQACGCLADVSDLAGSSDLFFGYASLGRDLSDPACGDLAGAAEVYLCFTASTTGNLVLSTAHLSTNADTVLALRDGSCAGASLGCAASSPDAGRARLVVPVTAGDAYVAMVESADASGGIFALGIHPEGVCEGVGAASDVTDALLGGQRFDLDPSASTASQAGSCGGAASSEALLSFVAPRTGTLVATTAGAAPAPDPATLYARQGEPGGAPLCDDPEAEVACSVQASPAGVGAILRFDAKADHPYSLFVDGRDGSPAGALRLTVGYAAQTPYQDALEGCDHAALRDDYGLFARSGQAVTVRVDTVDAETAADTRLRIRNPDGSELYEADDEVDCTFPPPAYRCPEHTFTAPTDGLYTLEVYVGTSEQCASQTLARYELTAEVAGSPAELILVRDQ